MANDSKELINITEEKPFTVFVSILFENIYDWAIILLTNGNVWKISETDKNEFGPVVGLDSKQNKLSHNFLSQDLITCACVLSV
jgi:hypothetical protein